MFVKRIKGAGSLYLVLDPLDHIRIMPSILARRVPPDTGRSRPALAVSGPDLESAVTVASPADVASEILLPFGFSASGQALESQRLEKTPAILALTPEQTTELASMRLPSTVHTHMEDVAHDGLVPLHAIHRDFLAALSVAQVIHSHWLWSADFSPEAHALFRAMVPPGAQTICMHPRFLSLGGRHGTEKSQSAQDAFRRWGTKMWPGLTWTPWRAATSGVITLDKEGAVYCLPHDVSFCGDQDAVVMNEGSALTHHPRRLFQPAVDACTVPPHGAAEPVFLSASPPHKAWAQVPGISNTSSVIAAKSGSRAWVIRSDDLIQNVSRQIRCR